MRCPDFVRGRFCIQKPYSRCSGSTSFKKTFCALARERPSKNMLCFGCASSFQKSGTLAREVLQTFFSLQHLSSESVHFFSFCLPLQWESMFFIVITASGTKLVTSFQSGAMLENMYSGSIFIDRQVSGTSLATSFRGVNVSFVAVPLKSWPKM